MPTRTLLLVALAASQAVPAQGPVFDDERPRLPGRQGPGMASAVADVDGDGLPDVIRVAAGGLDVVLQDRAGIFGRARASIPLSLPPGASVVSLCTGALRPGATLPDIVIGVTGADSLLFRNDGSGGFGQQVPSPLPRPAGFSGATTQVLVADLDRMVGDDVLVLHDGAMPQLFVLQANGTFVERGRSWFPIGFFPQSPRGVLASFIGGAFPDLVVVRRGVASRPILLANQGGAQFVVRPGAFAAVPPTAAGAVTAGDATGDGIADVVLGSAAAVGGSLSVLANDGQGVFSVAPLVGFQVNGALELAVGPVDGDARNDLVVLQASGEVGVAIARNGMYPGLQSVLPPGSRQTLALVDLEVDGDRDLYVMGADLEDSLLLGDGTGAFAATEEVTLPTGALARSVHLTLLDVTGEGDPDLVGYDSAGTPISFANDGSARFVDRPGLLPSLASGLVRDLAPGSCARPLRSDLVVLASRPASPRVGVHVMVHQGGRLQDETATRWPGNLTANFVAMAVGDLVQNSPGTTGLDDIVTADDQGGITLFENQSGVYSATSVFLGVTVTGAVQLLIDRVDGDVLPDLVVLRLQGPPAVFLGLPGGGFVQVPQPNLGPIPARQGILAELTGDGVADLAVVARSQPGGLFLLRGVGNGTFLDISNQAPGPLPGGLTSVAAVGGSAQRPPEALVFGSALEPDVVFARQGSTYAVRSVLPERGSRGTAGVLVGDLDVDGDEDLVLVRSQSLPRVLFDQRLQWQSRGVAQLGRMAELRARLPNPGVMAVFVGPQTVRLPFPPFGLLRIHPLSLVPLGQFVVPPSGVVDIALSSSRTWPPFELPMQVGYVDTVASQILLSNLEHLTFVGF